MAVAIGGIGLAMTEDVEEEAETRGAEATVEGLWLTVVERLSVPGAVLTLEAVPSEGIG